MNRIITDKPKIALKMYYIMSYPNFFFFALFTFVVYATLHNKNCRLILSGIYS